MEPINGRGTDAVEYLPAVPITPPLPLSSTTHAMTPSGHESVSGAEMQLVMALVQQMDADPSNDQGFKHNPDNQAKAEQNWYYTQKLSI